MVGVSLPTFLIGILLILVFAVMLGWLPSFGRGDTVALGWWTTGLLTTSGLRSLILPSITLALFQTTLIMYAGRIVEIGPVADVIHRPRHPYTVGLMGSIPSIGATVERLTQIDGSMPRLDAVPTGCAFHPRCPRAIERCSRERPELEEAGTTRAACWLAGVPVEVYA